jgi:pectinesterase
MSSARTYRLVFTVLMVLALESCVASSWRYDAKVSLSPGQNVFHSVQAAIDAAPEVSARPYRIYIAEGVYREKLRLPKNNIALIGAGRDKTRLVFDDYAGKLASGQMLTTPGSATLTITGADIRVEKLSIENGFDFLANDKRANDDPQKIAGSQAVALLIDGSADRIRLRDVKLLGNQDTLFVNAGRSWFDKVLVAGNVDFIFGKGNALFTDSEIKTLPRAKPGNPLGYITAPSTAIGDEFGLTFIRCRLTRDPAVPDRSVALGRPWHPTTLFPDGRYADPNAIGKAVFISSWMDAHITSDGWYSMSGSTKEGGRKVFLPEDSRFFEHASRGPGAEGTYKRRQLIADDLKRYAVEFILGDWRPD